MEDRKQFAAHAFEVSSHYDTAIFNYFNRAGSIEALKVSESEGQVLRYGENPHQSAAFYIDAVPGEASVATARQLQGSPNST